MAGDAVTEIGNFLLKCSQVCYDGCVDDDDKGGAASKMRRDLLNRSQVTNDAIMGA
jgi:hypothetical protein